LRQATTISSAQWSSRLSVMQSEGLTVRDTSGSAAQLPAEKSNAQDQGSASSSRARTFGFAPICIESVAKSERPLTPHAPAHEHRGAQRADCCAPKYPWQRFHARNTRKWRQLRSILYTDAACTRA